jgi:hypothetical protein
MTNNYPCGPSGPLPGGGAVPSAISDCEYAAALDRALLELLTGKMRVEVKLSDGSSVTFAKSAVAEIRKELAYRRIACDRANGGGNRLYRVGPFWNPTARNHPTRGHR